MRDTRRDARTLNPPWPDCIHCHRPINRWGGACMDCRLADRKDTAPECA